jgi:hypothetical protein
MKEMKGQKNIVKSKPIFESMNNFLENNKKSFVWLALIIGTLMSFLMFDMKASLSGDDSDYVLYADKFCHSFTFPGFRGPLYSIILSPFVLIFGVNLFVLKALSAVFILLSIWLLYKSFCNKIKAVILIPAILLVSVCSHVFFYASYTYSEPFFMFLQSLFIYFFSKYFLTDDEKKYTLKSDWKKYLILGLLILALGLTRSIGFVILGAIILYFAIKLRWKDMFFTLSSTGIVFLVFQIFKKIVWPTAGSAYDLQNYLAKNYYNLNQGMEDISGFVERLMQNSNVYLSKFLYVFMGFRPEDTQIFAPFLTVFTYILFIICFVAVFKKSKSLLFVGLYAGVMNFSSFIILQSNWEQDRLIMIYYPLMLLFLLGGIFYLFANKLRKFKIIYPLIIISICIGSLSHSQAKISHNFPILKRNISGDKLAGLTPDWRNFILMSQWAAKNTDKNDVIVSRKASISYIYTGRQFFGISSVPTQPIDSLPTVTPNGKTILITDAHEENIENLTPCLKLIINGSVKFEDKISTLVYIYEIDNDKLEEIITQLDDLNIEYSLDSNKFIESCKETPTDINIYNPYELLNNIEEQNVKYILMPSLRLKPEANTGQIIFTLNRYLSFINIKYPNRFFVVKTIGTSEPCELLEYAPSGTPTTL